MSDTTTSAVPFDAQYQRLTAIFNERYAKKPEVAAFAPGRVNLIGEHTDYNNGFVLPGAVEQGARFLLAKGEGQRSRIYSADYDEAWEFDAKAQKPLPGHSWKNYALGVVLETFKTANAAGGSVDIVFSGDVPQGAGMSSSAAMECGLASGLNELFGFGLAQMDIMRIAHTAENKYAGVRCGIMDQYASVFGQKDALILIDCCDETYKVQKADFGAYALLLLDTGVKHSHTSSGYNERRAACEAAAEAMGVPSLREADLTMLEGVRKQVGEEAYLRSKHVIEENARVGEVCRALDAGDLDKVGQTLFVAHDSYSQQFEASCPEADFLAEYAKKDDSALGARLMGGGFGGSVIHLIKADEVDAYVERVAKAYQAQFGIELTPRSVSLGDGARAQRLD